MSEYSPEEIMFNFLKLPFLNISKLQLMKDEDDLTRNMGSKGGFNLEEKNVDENGKFNPLKPHLGIFKDFLKKFKQVEDAKMTVEEEEKDKEKEKRSQENKKKYCELICEQMNFMEARLNYLTCIE